MLLIKADGESAFLKEHDGVRVSLRLIKDLFLGPQQKLYKIGVFVEIAAGTSPRDASDFTANVFDHLMSDTSDREAAAYFYRIFLGCRLAESAQKRTRQFLELTSDFINGLTKISKSDRVDIKNSLKVYLKNQKLQFSVSDFADEFLHQEYRAEYKRFMRGKKFPQGAVSKDVSAIKNKLRLQNVVFTSSVKISAPADEFKNSVKIGTKENGWTHVQILGEVEGD